MQSRWAVAVLAILFLVGACGEASAPTPSVGEGLETSHPTLATARSTTEPVPAVSGSAIPAPTIRSTPSPTATARPTPTERPSFTAQERYVLGQLRTDARIDCAPRRTGLPAGADAGVECRVHSALVDRVGIYSLPESGPESALGTYLARLAQAGVKPQQGDCARGTPGDSSWPSYLADEDGGGGISTFRSGCFLDDSGQANVRVTCYGGIYIGVVGKNDDLAALYAWAWRVAKGESTHRDPPGICAAPD